ncbi:suppressor APC domain-containing protein 1 [Periophthalmus magnuspinnatus]|uniref:suppressor APC domain-containing protein 1 n=1 Tax=Periophthalmus magnuspinnatus TaxID=409849 RepID=UPI002436508D|nr:suppressor APC domain-containing protein 1 [Periophthalmus magnuspinnatus]
MACHSPSFGSYTVAIIPFKTSLFSLDSLHFYLWVKHLKHLEQEKDALWCGLEILEKARLWYLQRIQENRHRQDHTAPTWTSEANFCLLRSRIQRANGSLGSVMNEPNVTSSMHSLPEAVGDSNLRWHNTILIQEFGDMNHQICLLQKEKDALMEQLKDLQAH